jgi:hypothetical protein
MQPFATFDDKGAPTGFYFGEIHPGAIPADAIKITEADYQAFIEQQGQWVYKGGVRVAAEPPTAEDLLPGIRQERDRRLSACDWTVLPDSQVADKQAWLKYRQALRDFPVVCDPAAPAWPTRP